MILSAIYLILCTLHWVSHTALAGWLVVAAMMWCDEHDDGSIPCFRFCFFHLHCVRCTYVWVCSATTEEFKLRSFLLDFCFLLSFSAKLCCGISICFPFSVLLLVIHFLACFPFHGIQNYVYSYLRLCCAQEKSEMNGRNGKGIRRKEFLFLNYFVYVKFKCLRFLSLGCCCCFCIVRQKGRFRSESRWCACHWWTVMWRRGN